MKSPLIGNVLPSKSGICYDHLSDHVKPCLVCLASYPKDENIWISELKDLLIVQGLVEQIEMKSAEEVVNELISSSLVIPFDNSICKMGITLTDSLLNEIGMLVHLKYLIIQTKANTLPPSFSNLCNLETLAVDNSEGSCMILSPWFWSLAKLRDVRMKWCAHFDQTMLDEDSRLENLRTLYELCLPGSEDMEDITFKRFPKLQNLEVCIEKLPDCSAEKTCFPRLKTLKLKGLALTYDTLSRIARLPNLQKLILVYSIIEGGKEWNMEDVTFQNLKYLQLCRVEFSEWQVDAEKSFPVLEELDIRSCDKLMDIPDSFGDIVSLKLINIWFCPQLKNSTFNIKEYVEEMTGEEKLVVCFQGRFKRDHINL